MSGFETVATDAAGTHLDPMHTKTPAMNFTRITNASFCSVTLTVLGAFAAGQDDPVLLADTSARAHISKTDVSGVALSSARPDHTQMYYSDVGGDIWARGASYKARFGTHGTELIPLFGAAAPRNDPLELELASVALAGDPLPFGAPVTIERDSDRVVYHRGSLDEVYDLTPRAVEQSFVFATLPVRGALSLRIAYEGAFAAVAENHGVRFAHELGAVMCSGAVAFDAKGNRIELDVTLDGSTLAIDVPASFVAAASLPLTVDPVLTTISIDVTTQDDVTPDVAYDRDSDVWRVVYEERVSMIDSDVYSASFHSDGTLQAGSDFYVDMSSERWSHPRIAHNYLNQMFVVVAEAGPVGLRRIASMAISAVNLQHGVPDVVADNSNGEKFNPDLGGDSTGVAPTYFCVVYERYYSFTDHDIHARLLSTGGLPYANAILVDNSSGTVDSRPAISECNGSSPFALQNWTIAWERQVSANSHDIYAACVHCDGSIANATFNVASAAADETNPVVSSPLEPTSGPRTVLIAWELLNPSGDHDIVVSDHAGNVLVNSMNLSQFEGAAGLDQRSPSLACDGSQFGIAFSEQWYAGAADYDVWVTHLAFTGSGFSISSPRDHVGWSSSVDANPSLCSARSGGLVNSTTFGMAWDLNVGGSSLHDVLGAILSGPQGGAITSYCGGNSIACPCNNPGAAGHGCPNSASSQGALLSAQGAANVSSDTLVFTASGMPATASCLFFEGVNAVGVPFGDGVKCVSGGVTRLGLKISSGGFASYPQAGDAAIAIKGLVPAYGATRYYQVWYRDPASFCGSDTFNMTNALKVTWVP